MAEKEKIDNNQPVTETKPKKLLKKKTEASTPESPKNEKIETKSEPVVVKETVSVPTEVTSKSVVKEPEKMVEKKVEKEDEPEVKSTAEESFTIKMKDGTLLKNIFKAVASIISETRIMVKEDGITLIAMDGAHICLIYLHLDKKDLDEFVLSKPLEFGISLDDFVKIMDRINKKEQLILSLKPNSKKIGIQFVPENSKKIRSFNLDMVSIDTEQINMEVINGMNFDNQCTFALELLDESIKDAEIFSEVLVVEQKGDQKLRFSTEGSIGDMECVLEKDELMDSNFTSNAKNVFAIQYLKNIIKINSITKNAIMKFKSEAPLKLELKILENSLIHYALAPRVEEETTDTEDQ